VFGALKRQWRELRKAPAGRRFQQRYERNRHARDGKLAWRIVQITVAILLIVAGIIFCFIPGPGLPLIFIGGGLLANHSLAVARFLDWSELRIRRMARWAKQWWLHASTFARYAVVLVAALLAGGTGYGAYEVIFRR
jgi:hypothetical protein